MQTLHEDQFVGSTLGEYQIERLLGRGQFSTVYVGRQLSQARAVMITTFSFPEELSLQERNQLTSRVDRERAALARLTHPHILPVYDVGEQPGYLYLVTACVKGASLDQVLQQQGRLTPQQTLDVLRQLGAGLDFAHSQGVLHGALSLSNALASDGPTVHIAGFGLRTILEAYSNTQNTQIRGGLLNAHGALLGSPEYASPEQVLGGHVDARSDIYALGVMLFQLLSGRLPFRGANPLATALLRVQQPVPSLRAACPDVPEALDLVVSKALERDPAQRYQRAGDIAAAFERVLTIQEAPRKGSASRTGQVAHNPQLTLPPTVNWFDEAAAASGRWQLVPPIVTGHLPAVTSPPPLQKTTRDAVEGRQAMSPGNATHPDASTEMLPTKAVPAAPAADNPDSMVGTDPFAWWSAASATSAPPAAPGTFRQRPPVRLARSNPHSRRRPAQQDRRRFVTLMVAGTAGVLTVGGISFAHLVQSMKQSPSQTASLPTTGSTAPATTQGNTPTVGATPTVGTTQGTQKTPTPSTSPTAKPSPSATTGAQPSPTSQPTQQPTPKPTQPPQATPTPPTHTGTVIGHINMATNSSVSFTNPADGQGGLLLHLGNGNFVACERACTHAGVPVNYDAGSGQLLCPAHGAIFDPLNGFSHVAGSGPSGLGPLPQVTIRVNADGTITTG